MSEASFRETKKPCSSTGPVRSQPGPDDMGPDCMNTATCATTAPAVVAHAAVVARVVTVMAQPAVVARSQAVVVRAWV